MQFSILNESNLHKSLKNYYQELYEGISEVDSDNHIYDLVSKNGEIIEIQTKNLSALLPKIKDVLSKNKKIKIVHPVILKKTIITTDKNGFQLTKRISPVKESEYDIFDEITGIYKYLLDKNFTLDIVKVNIIEERIKTDELVQTKNKKRRFKKDWIKTGKRLEEIIEIKTFKIKQDYLNFLPDSLPVKFCAKDLQIELYKLYKNKRISKKANLVLWVLSHMELISYTETQKRSKYYIIKK